MNASITAETLGIDPNFKTTPRPHKEPWLLSIWRMLRFQFPDNDPKTAPDQAAIGMMFWYKCATPAQRDAFYQRFNFTEANRPLATREPAAYVMNQLAPVSVANDTAPVRENKAAIQKARDAIQNFYAAAAPLVKASLPDTLIATMNRNHTQEWTIAEMVTLVTTSIDPPTKADDAATTTDMHKTYDTSVGALPNLTHVIHCVDNLTDQNKGLHDLDNNLTINVLIDKLPAIVGAETKQWMDSTPTWANATTRIINKGAPGTQLRLISEANQRALCDFIDSRIATHLDAGTLSVASFATASLAASAAKASDTKRDAKPAAGKDTTTKGTCWACFSASHTTPECHKTAAYLMVHPEHKDIQKMRDVTKPCNVPGTKIPAGFLKNQRLVDLQSVANAVQPQQTNNRKQRGRAAPAAATEDDDSA